MPTGDAVLITGASGGIGSACAALFAAAGYTVGICCKKHQEEAQALARALSETSEAYVFCADLEREAEVLRLADEAREKLGFVSVLVNNAGIAKEALFDETTTADWDRLMAVNLKAPFLLMRELCKPMIQKKRGSIVNVASVWGQTGASMEVAYSASKAGLIGMTKALAKELAPSGIRVNYVCPGVTDTDMTAGFDAAAREEIRTQIPMRRFATPADIARAVFFLAGEDAAYITGQCLCPNGGMLI